MVKQKWSCKKDRRSNIMAKNAYFIWEKLINITD